MRHLGWQLGPAKQSPFMMEGPHLAPATMSQMATRTCTSSERCWDGLRAALLPALGREHCRGCVGAAARLANLSRSHLAAGSPLAASTQPPWWAGCSTAPPMSWHAAWTAAPCASCRRRHRSHHRQNPHRRHHQRQHFLLLSCPLPCHRRPRLPQASVPRLLRLLAAAAGAQVAFTAGKHACCFGRRPPCTLPPPARPAGDCPSSPLCRSTTAESGTLEILQDPCASSEKWSASDASLVVRPCSAVTLYQPGFIPGSCDNEPDGYTYLHIQ